MRKVIKFPRKIWLIVLLVLLGIPTGGYLLLTNRAVQTTIVNRFLNDLNEKIGTEISLGSVKVKFFNKVEMSDVLILDQRHDTLVFVPKLELSLDTFNINRRQLAINKAKIYSPKANVIQDSQGVFNYQFIIDSLKSVAKPENKWQLSIQKVLVGNGEFLVDLTRNPAVNLSSPLLFHKTSLTTNIHHLAKDSANIELGLLKFVEDRGLLVKKMSADLAFGKSGYDVRNILINSVKSKVNIPEFFLQSDSGFSKEWIGQAQFRADVKSINLSPEDVEPYHAFFSKVNETLHFHGLIEGQVDNFSGKDLKASLGNSLDLLFDIDAYDLDRIKQAFYHAEFRKLYIDTRKFPLIYERIFGKSFPIKKELYKLGHVVYEGGVTGFYGDLVTYGNFVTEVGLVSTDLSIKRLPKSQKTELSGQVSAQKFDLGTFFNWNTSVGKVTMKVELEGDKMPNEPFSLYINGSADSLEFNDYTYNNVYLKGVFGNKNFNGGIDIRDPNLRLIFTGRIDFSADLPVFNFESDVYDARPSNLNFYSKFPNDKLQLRVKTKLQGNSIDNLTGFVGLSEIKYHNMNGLIEMDNASLMFTPGETNPGIEINSDFVEMTLDGLYNFSELRGSLAGILKPYLPSVAAQYTGENSIRNKFDYEISVHDFSDLARILELPVSISSDGEIKGSVNDESGSVAMEIDIPNISLGGFDIEQLDLKIQNKNRKPLSVVTHANTVFMGKKKIENLVSRWVAGEDEINTNTVWENDQEKEFRGDINVDFVFSDSIKDNLLTDVRINPSELVLSDSVWSIDHSVLRVDSSGMVVHDFRFGEKERYIEADGKLSRSLKDSLSIRLQNIDMRYLSDFVHIKKLDLKGMLRGKGVMYSGLKKPIILSDLTIHDLYINDYYADALELKSEWDDDLGLMNLELSNTLNDHEQIGMTGTFNPKNKNVDFLFEVEHCRGEYFQPYLMSVVQGLEGTASGPMHVYGTGLDLVLEGYALVENTSVNIDYLKTSYFVNDTIFFEKDNILFKDFYLRDRENHLGSINGDVKHTTFKNMSYNLVVDFNNCLVLDTRERDNYLYYGTVYASGVAGISGKGSKMLMDISGKTEANTVVKLPLSAGEVAGESDFVRFVKSSTVVDKSEEKELVSRDGTSGLTLNLEVEITPDAYAELIFDSRVGDVIKGRGSGTLVLKYDTYEDFKMYGEYTVVDGEYLFTLQNIINKRFEIESGGTITWGGSPYDADIDLDAYYQAKASLNDLIPGYDLSSDVTRRIPVNCHMMLTERLMNPSIQFDIELPTAPQETQQQVANVISTQDELNRQIFSLLALNSFVTPDHLLLASSTASSGINSQSAATVTTFEFFSNQLSHWLSQISSDFDLGINYRPSDLLTSQEIEVMMSTQIFNDKVSINGNFGYREMQAVENASNFVGDFDVDVKLNQTGNLRLKAYTHTNDRIFYESKTKQGVGFIYKEEFDNWEELMETYKQRKTNRERRREEKKEKKEQEKEVGDALVKKDSD